MKVVGLIVATGLLLPSCTVKNPAICCASRADCDSIQIDDTMRTCGGGLVCVDHMCVASQCEIDQDCGDATPVCAPEGVCVGCVTSEQCTGNTPVCDATTRACSACSIDADCASNACDFETGACIAESSVVYASPTGGDTTGCEKTDPCSIVRAFNLANAVRNTIKLDPGTYSASLTVTGKRLVVHGDEATLTAATTRNLSINDNGELRVYGLSIVNPLASTTNEAVNCSSSNMVDSPIVELHRCSVDAEKFPVYVGSRCNATIAKSRLRSRATAGGYHVLLATGTVTVERTLFDGGNALYAAGGRIRVSNSVIANIRGPDGAVIAGGGGHLTVSFSTVVNSPILCGNAIAACTSSPATGVCIDNSIIANTQPGAPADTLSGTNCAASYTLITPQASSVPGANNMLGRDPLFVNESMGDYRLLVGSPAIDAADVSVMVTPDFEGTPRPQGVQSDLGALEFKP